MNKRHGLFFLLLVFALFPYAAQASTILTISPTGAIAGAPGTTVGWGFSLLNTTNFLTVTGSDFCEGPPSTPCAHSLGFYTDFIGPNFVVVGPSPESPNFTQAFNAVTFAGLGSFTIVGSATPGSSAVGNLFVTYDLYSLSPNDLNFNPTTNLISSGNVLSAAASVTVLRSIVPEPSSYLMFAGGAIAIATLRRFHKCT